MENITIESNIMDLNCIYSFNHCVNEKTKVDEGKLKFSEFKIIHESVFVQPFVGCIFIENALPINFIVESKDKFKLDRNYNIKNFTLDWSNSKIKVEWEKEPGSHYLVFSYYYLEARKKSLLLIPK